MNRVPYSKQRRMRALRCWQGATSRYELVAGAPRFRAPKLAKRESTPATSAAPCRNASRTIGTPQPSSKTSAPRPSRCGSFADGLRGKSILTSRMHRLTGKTKSYCHPQERAPAARGKLAATRSCSRKFHASPPFAQIDSAARARQLLGNASGALSELTVSDSITSGRN